MKPRKTPECNLLLRLVGGNEDSFLDAESTEHQDGSPLIITEWEFTPAEREAIAVGGRVQLLVWGTGHPPVALATVLRAASGDLIPVEPGEKTRGTAVVLPAQAERLRGWLAQGVELLGTQRKALRTEIVKCEACQLANDVPDQFRCHHQDELATLTNTVAEMDDLINSLQPIEDKAP